MPNGYAEERDQVYRASQFWGAIWQIGDTAYYFGAIGSVLVPLLIVGASINRFQSWQGLLQSVGWAVFALLFCFSVGFGLCRLLKGWARRRTGVEPRR